MARQKNDDMTEGVVFCSQALEPGWRKRNTGDRLTRATSVHAVFTGVWVELRTQLEEERWMPSSRLMVSSAEGPEVKKLNSRIAISSMDVRLGVKIREKGLIFVVQNYSF